MKFEKHYARCTDLAAQHRSIFFFLWAGYWKVQKGKGTMRPMTRLNFLVAVYEKTKGLLSLRL